MLGWGGVWLEVAYKWFIPTVLAWFLLPWTSKYNMRALGISGEAAWSSSSRFLPKSWADRETTAAILRAVLNPELPKVLD